MEKLFEGYFAKNPNWKELEICYSASEWVDGSGFSSKYSVIDRETVSRSEVRGADFFDFLDSRSAWEGFSCVADAFDDDGNLINPQGDDTRFEITLYDITDPDEPVEICEVSRWLLDIAEEYKAGHKNQIN